MPIVGDTITATVGVASAQIIGYSEKRRSIVFHPPSNNRVTIQRGPVAVLDAGPTLQQGQAPLEYTWHKHGQLVFGPFSAIANLAGVNIGVSESFDV